MAGEHPYRGWGVWGGVLFQLQRQSMLSIPTSGVSERLFTTDDTAHLIVDLNELGCYI